MIEEIYEKCEVDSGNSSGSGNSSCDEIDVESIDSDRKFEKFEKSCDSIPVGTSDGDSLSSENRSENQLDPVQTSSFSISNLLMLISYMVANLEVEYCALPELRFKFKV